MLSFVAPCGRRWLGRSGRSGARPVGPRRRCRAQGRGDHDGVRRPRPECRRRSGRRDLDHPARRRTGGLRAEADDARKLADADLIVSNGVGLDDFLDKLIEAAGEGARTGSSSATASRPSPSTARRTRTSGLIRASWPHYVPAIAAGCRADPAGAATTRRTGRLRGEGRGDGCGEQGEDRDDPGGEPEARHVPRCVPLLRARTTDSRSSASSCQCRPGTDRVRSGGPRRDGQGRAVSRRSSRRHSSAPSWPRPSPRGRYHDGRDHPLQRHRRTAADDTYLAMMDLERRRDRAGPRRDRPMPRRGSGWPG